MPSRRCDGRTYTAHTVPSLNAADYGVPQTRQRAFLMAHRTRSIQPPAPTHTRHPQPALFGDDLAPWVSMADALDWSGDGRDWSLCPGSWAKCLRARCIFGLRCLGRWAQGMCGDHCCASRCDLPSHCATAT